MSIINQAEEFGSVVKSARHAKGITQSFLADRLSITTRYLKAIENSGRKPSFDLLERIMEELGIQSDTVFCYMDDKTEISVKVVPFRKVI